MFKTLLRFSRVTTGAILVSAGLLAAPQAQASLIPCGASSCSTDFNVTIDGTSAGSGQLVYDAKTGEISLGSGTNSWSIGDSTISVNSLSGNADPILAFGLGALTGASGSTFGFTFNLPIALQGQIDASSSVSYSLTSTSSAGAQIAPISGNVVKAYEVDTSVGGLGSLNKGVDVGDTFFFTGGPQTQNSAVFTANNTFTGNLAYDLMTVKVDFSLSANSTVGLSGFVQQVPAVPIPAAAWLFGSGLLGLLAVARRKRS